MAGGCGLLRCAHCPTPQPVICILRFCFVPRKPFLLNMPNAATSNTPRCRLSRLVPGSDLRCCPQEHSTLFPVLTSTVWMPSGRTWADRHTLTPCRQHTLPVMQLVLRRSPDPRCPCSQHAARTRQVVKSRTTTVVRPRTCTANHGPSHDDMRQGNNTRHTVCRRTSVLPTGQQGTTNA